MEYWNFIIERGLSGVMNGLFYIGSVWAWPVLILLLGFTVYSLIKARKRNIPKWKKILFVLGIVCTTLSIIFVGLSFHFPNWRWSEIHLWTWMTQTSLAATFFISAKRFWKNFIWLCLTVSPSAFLQKLFINVIIGLPWDAQKTDDPSGKTWGMTLFGKRVKVPRMGNMWIRLILALICVGVYIYLHYFTEKHVDFA